MVYNSGKSQQTDTVTVYDICKMQQIDAVMVSDSRKRQENDKYCFKIVVRDNKPT